MIQSLFLDKRHKLSFDIPVEAYASCLHQKNTIFWVDFVDEDNAATETILHDIFGFHPLAIEDALEGSYTPKVDDWGHYLYICLDGLIYEPTDSEEPLQALELDLFIADNFLVTLHSSKLTQPGKIWNTCQRDQRALQHGVDHLLYRIIDELVTNYLPIMDAIDDDVDNIQDEILDHGEQSVQQRLFTAKRTLLKLRRIIAPQREVIAKLSRGDFPMIDAKDRVFFRDIYDQHVRLYDIIESLRDLVNGAMDIYLSVVNNRMNEVMKTLTIITTLFMPLTFLTGFFGMNFFQPSYPLPAWTGMPIFILMLASTIGLPVLMYFWMRKRKWM